MKKKKNKKETILFKELKTPPFLLPQLYFKCFLVNIWYFNVTLEKHTFVIKCSCLALPFSCFNPDFFKSSFSILPLLFNALCSLSRVTGGPLTEKSRWCFRVLDYVDCPRIERWQLRLCSYPFLYPSLPWHFFKDSIPLWMNLLRFILSVGAELSLLSSDLGSPSTWCSPWAILSVVVVSNTAWK